MNDPPDLTRTHARVHCRGSESIFSAFTRNTCSCMDDQSPFVLDEKFSGLNDMLQKTKRRTDPLVLRI